MKAAILTYGKPVIYSLIFGLTITIFSQSCGTTRAGVTQTASQPVKPAPKAALVHDTVTIQRKPMTQAEFQAFMKKQYQLNYDLLFLPEFRKITAENEVLKSDLHGLTLNITSIVGLLNLSKHQKDSIQRMETYYRDQNFRYQQENLRLKNEGVETQKQSTAQIAKFMEKTDSTIKFLNKLTKSMLIVGIAIGGIVLILIVAVFLLWNKVHLLRKQVHVN